MKQNETEFTVVSKKTEDYFRGDDFRKQVLLCQSPEKLLEFMVSHEFIAEEIYFFVERVSFVCSKITREIATDKILEQLAMIIRLVFIIAKSFDKENPGKKYEEGIKTILHPYITGINALVEYRANEVFDVEHLISLFGTSLDPKRFAGPIREKIRRLQKD